MRYLKHVSAIFALGCATLSALPAIAQTDPIADEHAVLNLEDQYLSSRATNDPAVIDKTFAEDGVVIHENGDERPKAAYRADLASQPRWVSLSTTERVIHLYGDAAVTHAILYVKMASAAVTRLRTTAVYTRQAAGWRIVSWQATPLADARYAVKP